MANNVEQSLFNLSDHETSYKIYETHIHRHDDEKLDIESLFIVVENILKRATQIVDNFVLGTPVPTENLEEKIPKASFRVPLCKLKKISCEMQCKDPGEQIAKETALSILNTQLSGYSWAEKAVLTLAAFALEYGEFWILSQNEPSDQVAKSVGILRGVPFLLKSPSLEKHRTALIELNNIIKTTLEVIQCIFELEKFPNYVAEFEPAEISQVDAYWAILTVVASAIQFCCLVNDKDKTQELAPFAHKLSFIDTKLTKQIFNYKIQEDSYLKLEKRFQHPTEIMETIKELIYATDNKHDLFDGFIKETVSVEVLRRKNILLLISGLDISDDDISILKPIHDEFKRNDQYKIVWIPIVDQWTDNLQNKFEILRHKMPWYIVPYFSSRVGTRFIKEKWHYKNNPIIVVLNPQGGVECEDAIDMIRLWRMKAFPFTRLVLNELSSRRDWIWYIAADFNPMIERWVKEDKYIFFYGGKNDKWIQQFKDRVTKLASDKVKEANIFIELFCVGKGSKGEDQHGVLERFWNRIDSLFITNAQSNTEADDDVSLEIKTLLSLKNNECGWAVLSKGSTVVFSGHGSTVLKALEEFEKWKQVKTPHICCRNYIPIAVSGKIPQNKKCPDCHRNMERYVGFKCCHIDGSVPMMNGHH